MDFILMIVKQFIMIFISELAKAFCKNLTNKTSKSSNVNNRRNNQAREVTVLFIKISNFR